MVRPVPIQDLYQDMRRRIIGETEAFLEEHLEHPESLPRIPTMIVGTGSFSRRFADSFWFLVLRDEAASRPFWRRWWRR